MEVNDGVCLWYEALSHSNPISLIMSSGVCGAVRMSTVNGRSRGHYICMLAGRVQVMSVIDGELGGICRWLG
jgi:hypothetical protein